MKLKRAAWFIVFFTSSLVVSSGLLADDSADCPGSTLVGSHYFGQFSEYEFGCDTLFHRGYDPDKEEWFKETHRYRVEEESGLTFVYVKLRDDESKWLAIHGDGLMFLFAHESEQPFFAGATGSKRRLQTWQRFQGAVSASSHLVEGGTSYTPDQVRMLASRLPWVEGVPGQGEGEQLTVEPWYPSILISIGFVSYDRPELYELNSRPKRLRVVSDATGEERIVDLEDTPNLQPIEVPGEWESAGDGGIRLIIEEVYPGTRWDDTCINFIVFF